MPDGDVLLQVRGLQTYFFLDEGTVKAVDGVDLEVRRGRTLCIVGESGCGKSMTARSILQVVSPPGKIVAGEILFQRQAAGATNVQPTGSRADVVDLARLSPRGSRMRAIRGQEISMIFQEPMTSLSPVHTIGDQIMENVLLHLRVSKQDARKRTVAVLSRWVSHAPSSAWTATHSN
jgi:peptide/nickel transport system ATP-binding protein